MLGALWTRLSAGFACECPRRGLFGLLGGGGRRHLGSGGKWGGRSRILGCVGLMGGARVLGGLPGASLSLGVGRGGGLYDRLVFSPSLRGFGGEFGRICWLLRWKNVFPDSVGAVT